jgi:hypothetical protein
MQMPLSSKDFLCHNLGAKHLQFVRSIPSEALKSIPNTEKSSYAGGYEEEPTHQDEPGSHHSKTTNT